MKIFVKHDVILTLTGYMSWLKVKFDQNDVSNYFCFCLPFSKINVTFRKKTDTNAFPFKLQNPLLG